MRRIVASTDPDSDSDVDQAALVAEPPPDALRNLLQARNRRELDERDLIDIAPPRRARRRVPEQGPSVQRVTPCRARFTHRHRNARHDDVTGGLRSMRAPRGERAARVPARISEASAPFGL